MFGGAGGLALYGAGALVAGLILLLATAVDGWIAAFIVSAALFAIAGILALTGKKQIDQATPPAAGAGDGEHATRRRRSESEGFQVTPPKDKTRKKDPQAEAEELREEIEETREELGDTVEQLAQKADVKGQAQAKVDERQPSEGDEHAQAAGAAGEGATPRPCAGIAAAIGGLLLLLWLLRRR